MPGNTVYGPYSPYSWQDGVTLGNQNRMNALESQAGIALHGFNADFISPFVLTGINCTKDGTVANQLDIASGVAYVNMGDGTIGKIFVNNDNTHTTSTPSTTYYLFLKNDGTWQWSTTSTGPTNSLAICQATTDGSGNISVVTDTRNRYTTVFAAADMPPLAPIIARTLNQHVTATTLVSLIPGGVAVPVQGFYRVSMAATFLNPTPEKISMSASWTSPNVAGATQGYFTAVTGTPGLILNGSQASNMGSNQDIATQPITFYAKAGTTIGVFYQDPAGTPNDFVTAIVERIA